MDDREIEMLRGDMDRRNLKPFIVLFTDKKRER